MEPSTDGMIQTFEAELVAINQREQLQTQAAIHEAERRAELLGIVTIAACKRTYPQDWIDFRKADSDEVGKPYLGATGAERLRTLFGISITNLDIKRYEEKDREGPFYFYVVSADAHWRGDVVSVIGTCSSRDQFYRTRWQDVEGKRQQVLLPSEDIDPTNIIKAARSNMIANAVTGILGLRGLTWEQLKAFGIERGKGGVATFRDGKDKGAKPAAGAAPAAAPKEAPKTPVDQLEARLIELFGPDPAAASPVLLTVTSYVEKTETDEATGEVKVTRRAFPGFPTMKLLREKARKADQTAAIAIRKLNAMVDAGEISLPQPAPQHHQPVGTTGFNLPGPSEVAKADAERLAQSATPSAEEGYDAAQ